MDAHLLYTQQNPRRPSQHEITVATLPRLTRDELAARLLATSSAPSTSATATTAPSSSTSATSPARAPSLVVVDVRDSDFIGGHVRGCVHAPSNTLDWRMPELVRGLRHADTVVFHCALSQVRGPAAALRYVRERERVREEQGRAGREVKGEEGEGVRKEQQVYVLEGGFTEWQQKYGEDVRLTEGYQKDVWAFGGY